MGTVFKLTPVDGGVAKAVSTKEFWAALANQKIVINDDVVVMNDEQFEVDTIAIDFGAIGSYANDAAAKAGGILLNEIYYSTGLGGFTKNVTP